MVVVMLMMPIAMCRILASMLEHAMLAVIVMKYEASVLTRTSLLPSILTEALLLAGWDKESTCPPHLILMQRLMLLSMP